MKVSLHNTGTILVVWTLGLVAGLAVAHEVPELAQAGWSVTTLIPEILTWVVNAVSGVAQLLAKGFGA